MCYPVRRFNIIPQVVEWLNKRFSKPSTPTPVSFMNSEGSFLSSAYPCTFEFGGKYYSSADAAFQENRSLGCSDTDVMMHVLRAKFGQNPELKQQLLDTGSVCLLCEEGETDQNWLGSCLMNLRTEYQGNGPVPFSTAQHHPLANELQPECLRAIFQRCLYADVDLLIQLSRTNQYYNQIISQIAEETINLERDCPELTILNAETFGLKVDNEPRISKLATLKCYQISAHEVEENAGITVLTMYENFSLNELVKIAEKIGVSVEVVLSQIMQELGAHTAGKIHLLVITNHVFKNTRDLTFEQQKDYVQRKFSCAVPTILDTASLWFFSYAQPLSKFLFSGETYARTSTDLDGSPLVAGGGDGSHFFIYNTFPADYTHKKIGMGGCWKFG